MSWAGFALFAHLVAAFAGFMIAGVLHAGMILSRSATNVAEFKPWPRVFRRLEPTLGLFALAIFGTGVWLIVLHDEWISWSDGWIVASIVALVLVQAMGILLGPRGSAVYTAIENAPPDGPVTDDMRLDGVLFVAAHLSTALVLGILYLMVFKPSGIGSTVVLVVAAALGVVSALPFLQPSVRARDATVAIDA